jgi:hypothetical protein
MKWILGKTLFGMVLALLFLLPFFGWISAEPVPYRDPEGFFAVVPPDGWKTDDSGYMGQGVIIKGPAGKAGTEPVVHLIHEPSGIVTLDVQWHTKLGQIRYDLDRVKFLGLEDHEDLDPPYSQAKYSYVEGEKTFLAMVRLYRHRERFYLLTASAPEGEFEGLSPLFRSVFDSFSPGEGN